LTAPNNIGTAQDWVVMIGTIRLLIFLLPPIFRPQRRLNYRPKSERIVVSDRRRTVQTPKKQVARTTQKRKKSKSKPRYTAPPLSREEEAKIDRYRAKRDGIKFDDTWSSFGIPL